MSPATVPGASEPVIGVGHPGARGATGRGERDGRLDEVAIVCDELAGEVEVVEHCRHDGKPAALLGREVVRVAEVEGVGEGDAAARAVTGRVERAPPPRVPLQLVELEAGACEPGVDVGEAALPAV